MVELIEKETSKIKEINDNYGNDVLDKEISPQLVSERIKQANQVGELDSPATQTTIAIAMNSLGWALEKNSFKKMGSSVHTMLNY